MADKTGGPFHRKPLDRRFVKQANAGTRKPDYWTPMDLLSNECKLMEIKKFSAHYFDVDAKFRRPDLELVSAYTIQNPFLWGQFLLRREQLKMQLTHTGYSVKEKVFFRPTDTKDFERIVRNNFDCRHTSDPQLGVKFYSEALSANNSVEGAKNVKLMFMAKVLIGTCILTEEEPSAPPPPTGLQLHSKTNLPVDTCTNASKTTFYKHNMTEVYPDILLVYRDKKAGKDVRMSKLPVKHVKVSYRAGTRFNPHEEPIQEENKENVVENVDRIETAPDNLQGIFKQTDIEVAEPDDLLLANRKKSKALVVNTQPRKKTSFFVRKKSIEYMFSS